ncbi:MAG: hypothetical protein PHC45_08620 [Clostridiaceae bacterium]|nr:hypothetical protein [Clostridiaceae bacterium]
MRKSMIAILALLLIAALIGCSFDSLEGYKNAVKKTDQIKKGRTEGEFSLVMDFNTEKMTEEQIKELNYVRNMKGSFNVAYDDEMEKGIFRNYLNMGGLGFDLDLFVNGEEMFMKLPVIGKYMRLSEMKEYMIGTPEEDLGFVDRKTQDAINAKWLGLLKKEDIFKGKAIVLTTPDGEVKTTEYTIILNDEQIKDLAMYSMDMLYKDEKLKESYEKYISKNIESLKDTSPEELLSDMKESIKNYTVESFGYTAYVDIDGYIVNEMVEITLEVDNAEPGAVTRVSYELNIKNWDINKGQEFDFPALTDENTVDMDNMEQNMPFKIEALFNKKD